MTPPSHTPNRPDQFAGIYQCPDCEQRLLNQRRCPHCQLFCRRIDQGGNCPHCEEPVAFTDLAQPPNDQQDQEATRLGH